MFKKNPEPTTLNNDTTTKRRLYLAMLCLFFLSAIVLQVVLFCAEPMLSRDGALYATLIQKHCDLGESFFYDDFNKPPLLLIIGSFIYRDFHCPAEIALLAVNILSSALLIFPIAYIGKLLFHSRRTALFCALLIIGMPSLLSVSTGGTRESLFFFFSACSLACALTFCTQGSTFSLPISGCCVALAFLSRYEGVILIPIILTMLLVFCQPLTGWRKKISACLLFFISIAAAMGICFLLSPIIRTFFHLFVAYIKKFL